jgi:hypothetical protein
VVVVVGEEAVTLARWAALDNFGDGSGALFMIASRYLSPSGKASGRRGQWKRAGAAARNEQHTGTFA